MPVTPDWQNRLLKWVVAGTIAIGLVFLAVIAFVVLTDFANIPCQDGRWDAAKKTCIPT